MFSLWKRALNIAHIHENNRMFYWSLFSARSSSAYTCTNATQCKDEQCSSARMWCKWIGSVQMTLTWRPLLDRARGSRYTNPYLPSGWERRTETETRNKRAKIKWYGDVNRSWRVSCSVRRVRALSDIFNKVARATVDISALQEVSVLGCTGPLSHSLRGVHAICANCNYNAVSFRRAL